MTALVDNVHVDIHLFLHPRSSDWSWVRWRWSLAGSPRSGRRCRRRSGSSRFLRPRRQRHGCSRRGNSARTCSSRCSISGSMDNKHLFPTQCFFLFLFSAALLGIQNWELLISESNLGEIPLICTCEKWQIINLLMQHPSHKKVFLALWNCLINFILLILFMRGLSGEPDIP